MGKNVFLLLDQKITFPELANKFYGDAPIILEASASSGLTVTFAVISGPAVLDRNKLSVTGSHFNLKAFVAGRMSLKPRMTCRIGRF